MTVYLPSLSQDNVIYKVDKFHVIEELFSFFGKRVGSKPLNLEHKDENAFDDSVTKDVYSYLFKELFWFRCAGIDPSVFTSLTDEEAERVGMIITHAYVQQNILPAGLRKSVFEYMITNDVRDDTLLESFLLYIDVKERQLIKKAISDSSFIEKHHHELWDILLDCGLNSSPNVSNFSTLLKEAAENVFIKKPFFIINQIQLGLLGAFWGVIKIEDALWDTYKPNNENIMNCFEFDFDTTPGDDEVLS